MNNTTENTEKLRVADRLWAETKGGSVDHWIELMADEVDFRSLAAGSTGLEFTDSCCSKDEVKSYFDGLVSGWEMIDYKVDEYIAEGNRVVALGSCAWKNRNTGKSIDTPKADFFKFEDGKIVGFFEFYDTAMTLGAAQPD